MDFDSLEWFCLVPAYSLGRMIMKLSTIGYKFALVELLFLHRLLTPNMLVITKHVKNNLGYHCILLMRSFSLKTTT